MKGLWLKTIGNCVKNKVSSQNQEIKSQDPLPYGHEDKFCKRVGGGR